MLKIALLAGLVAPALAVIAPATAHAAAKPCAYGTWRLLGEQVHISGVNGQIKWAEHAWGAAGIKLTLSTGKAKYNFTGSAKEYASGTDRTGTRFGYWDRFWGTMTEKAKVTGTTKGLFTSKPHSATGNARGQSAVTYPTYHLYPSFNLVADTRNNGATTLYPDRAAYTCTHTSLTISASEKGHNTSGTWKSTFRLTYRRA